METRQKIIATSLVLFNREGCLDTSMRSIAAECQMSLSNLQHHFKKKEILIEAIFDDMCLVYDGASDFEAKGVSLKLLVDMNSLFAGFQKKYHFFFSEISTILQQYPIIQKRFAGIKSKRQNEYIQLFNAYAEEGLFRPEPFPGFFFAQAELLWFAANFFLSSQLAEGKKSKKIMDEETNRVFTNIMFPLLTEKGIAVLMQLNNP